MDLGRGTADFQTKAFLVVWNMTFIFHFIYGMSSFPLTFIFFRGLETTNQIYMLPELSA